MQVVDAPMLPTKFLCLKHLIVRLSLGTTITQAFDYFSLVSFLDASPSLETFILNVRCWHCQFIRSCKFILPFCPFSLIMLSFSSSGEWERHDPWIDFCTSTIEAHTWAPPWPPQECEDMWFQLWEKLIWTNTLYSWECGVTEISYTGHLLWGSVWSG